jgi:hypothetical protein
MFGLLVLVGLFVALTPGVLFRLKGSKKMSAAMHAVLFGVVVYLVSMYGPSYGISYEGFQSPMPACQGTSSFVNGMCVATTPAMCTSGTLGPGGKCYLSGRVVGMPVCPPNMQKQGGVCVISKTAVCPGGTNLTSDGMCKTNSQNATSSSSAAPGVAAGSEVFCNEDVNRVWKVASVNPNKTLSVSFPGQQGPPAVMPSGNCSLVSNYIGKEVRCATSNAKLYVKRVRPDAQFEVYAQATPNNIQAMPVGACRLVPTLLGAITGNK